MGSMALAGLGPPGTERGKQPIRAAPNIEPLLRQLLGAPLGPDRLQRPCPFRQRLDAIDVGFNVVRQFHVFAIVEARLHGTAELVAPVEEPAT